MTAPLFIIAGPSGVGKTTTTQKVFVRFPDIHRIVTITTRAPRAGEQYARDYLFVSEDAFVELEATHCFVETNHFAGQSYGTPRSMLTLLSRGIPCLVIPDINGTREIIKLVPSAISIWLDAPEAVLRTRLAARHSDSREQQEQRIAIAQREKKEALESRLFSHTIDMSNFDDAEAALQTLISQQLALVRC